MKVYRGPSTKPFHDDTHEHVSTVSAEELEESLAEGSVISFNITKEVNERQAICTTYFESQDVIPMINGIISRLLRQQEALSEIKKIAKKKKLDAAGKIEAIQAIIDEL
jgi:fructose 1,6-bisphosphatase